MNDRQKSKADSTIGGYGDLFKGMGNLFSVLSDLAEKGGEISKNGEIAGLGEKMRGVYGFSVRSGLGGAPRVSSFGNIKKTSRGPVVQEVREPLVDVFDEKKHVLVVAELPGVEEKDISLEVKDDILIISAVNKDRSYVKEVLLPRSYTREELTSSYKNGVLKVTFPKNKK